MKNGSYIKIDKSMLASRALFGLSLDSVLLYAYLLDLTGLSRKNGKVDADGRIRIGCTRETAARLLGCCEKTAAKQFRALIDAGLLEVDEHNGSRTLFVRGWCEPSERHSVEELRSGGFPPITADFSPAMEHYAKLSMEVLTWKGLDSCAKLLYALLSDKQEFADRGEKEFFLVDRRTLQKQLGCGRTSLSNAVLALEKAGLLERAAKAGYGKPVPLHINTPAYAGLPSRCAETEAPAVSMTVFPGSDGRVIHMYFTDPKPPAPYLEGEWRAG